MKTLTTTLRAILLLLFTQLITFESNAQQKGEPFEGIDVSWQNGSDRRDSFPFKDSKIFTPSVLVDVNYNFSLNDPINKYRCRFYSNGKT